MGHQHSRCPGGVVAKGGVGHPREGVPKVSDSILDFSLAHLGRGDSSQGCQGAPQFMVHGTGTGSRFLVLALQWCSCPAQNVALPFCGQPGEDKGFARKWPPVGLLPLPVGLLFDVKCRLSWRLASIWSVCPFSVIPMRLVCSQSVERPDGSYEPVHFSVRHHRRFSKVFPSSSAAQVPGRLALYALHARIHLSGALPAQRWCPCVSVAFFSDQGWGVLGILNLRLRCLLVHLSVSGPAEHFKGVKMSRSCAGP